MCTSLILVTLRAFPTTGLRYSSHPLVPQPARVEGDGVCWKCSERFLDSIFTPWEPQVKLLQGFEGSRFLLARLSVEKDSFISLIAGLNKGGVCNRGFADALEIRKSKKGFWEVVPPYAGLGLCCGEV